MQSRDTTPKKATITLRLEIDLLKVVVTFISGVCIDIPLGLLATGLELAFEFEFAAEFCSIAY
jgi:hypothetical protein